MKNPIAWLRVSNDPVTAISLYINCMLNWSSAWTIIHHLITLLERNSNTTNPYTVLFVTWTQNPALEKSLQPINPINVKLNISDWMILYDSVVDGHRWRYPSLFACSASASEATLLTGTTLIGMANSSQIAADWHQWYISIHSTARAPFH